MCGVLETNRRGKMKYTILDLETTGVPPKNANYEADYVRFPYILSFAWKCIKDGQESETFEYIINNPGVIITPEITAINGITQEMCDSSKWDIFTVLMQFIMDASGSDFIIGHNVYFDSSIIKANTMRIVSGGKTPMAMFEKISEILYKDKRIDTMRAGIKLCGKWPKLTELHMKLFGKTFEGAHTAAGDVNACYVCFQELLRRGLVKVNFPEKVVNGLVMDVILEEET